jgi:hypothetical protein
MYSHCICLPETGITLFVNPRSCIHLVPPIVICTVIIVVDTPARRQRFQATPLLLRMMSANNGPGGEPMRCSAVPLPSLPNRDNILVPSSFGVAPPTATAVVGGRHCSLIIVPLLQTVAVIVLIYLLTPERMPIPDHDSRPRKAT